VLVRAVRRARNLLLGDLEIYKVSHWCQEEWVDTAAATGPACR
jgi:hypothetical protein